MMISWLHMRWTQRGAQHVLKDSTLLEYLLQFWVFFAELIKTILLLLHVREKSIHFQLLWVQSFLNFLSYTDIVLLLVNGRDFGLHLSLQDQSNIKGLTPCGRTSRGGTHSAI